MMTTGLINMGIGVVIAMIGIGVSAAS